MVRNLVGSLVYIGAGKQPTDWLAFYCKKRPQTVRADIFSPAGLYLSAIHYPEHYQLPTPCDDFAQALGLN